MNAESIGVRLKMERKGLGISLKGMAERCGVHRNSQYNYEVGRHSPPADYLEKAALLGVDVLYVVTGKRSL